MVKWGKVHGFLRKHKQAITVFLKATNYSSKNNENSYGSKSEGKILAIHATKVYEGVEV